MKQFQLIKQTRQTTDYSCGACALQSVMSYWGKDVDERELMRLLGTTPEEGSHPEALIRVAQEHGLSAELRANLTLDEVAAETAKGRPAIVLGQLWRSQAASAANIEEEWDCGHWFIALAVDDKNVYIQDPWVRMGRGFMPREAFEACWHNVMGGDRSKPVQSHVAIFIHGDQPAAERARKADPKRLDFAKFGSLDLMVLHFPTTLLPFDFMEEVKVLLKDANGMVRPDAFIFLIKDDKNRLVAISGGGLDDEQEAMEVNAVLGVLAGVRLGGSDDHARERLQAAIKASTLGDFGLSEAELQQVATKLEPGTSAIIVLFENVWERRFREIAGKHGGTILSQQLVPSATLVQRAKELLG